MIQGYCCGDIAQTRSRYHQGEPLVFSVDLSSLDEERSVNFESSNGRIRRNRLIVEPSVVTVDSVYHVVWFIKNGVTILEKVSKEVLERNKFRGADRRLTTTI